MREIMIYSLGLQLLLVAAVTAGPFCRPHFGISPPSQSCERGVLTDREDGTYCCEREEMEQCFAIRPRWMPRGPLFELVENEVTIPNCPLCPRFYTVKFDPEQQQQGQEHVQEKAKDVSESRFTSSCEAPFFRIKSKQTNLWCCKGNKDDQSTYRCKPAKIASLIANKNNYRMENDDTLVPSFDCDDDSIHFKFITSKDNTWCCNGKKEDSSTWWCRLLESANEATPQFDRKTTRPSPNLKFDKRNPRPSPPQDSLVPASSGVSKFPRISDTENPLASDTANSPSDAPPGLSDEVKAAILKLLQPGEKFVTVGTCDGKNCKFFSAKS